MLKNHKVNLLIFFIVLQLLTYKWQIIYEERKKKSLDATLPSHPNYHSLTE
jgi:hypothetical protein